MAIGFNGTDEDITTRTFDEMNGAGQWTSCIWVKPNIAATSAFYSISNNAAAPFLWEAFLDLTGAVSFNVETAGAAFTNGTTAAGAMANGNWYHLAQVFDGKGAADADKLKMYINGVSQSLTFSGATLASTLDALSTVMVIACRADGTLRYAGNAFNQQMWDIPLTNSEVIQSMLSIVPPRADRLRWWALYSEKADSTAVYSVSPDSNTQITIDIPTTADVADPLTAIKPSAMIPYWNTRRGMVGASRTRRNAQKTVQYSKYPGFHKGM